MPERPTLDGIRQASAGAFGKAKLMVGLKNEEDLESQQSETSSFLDEAVDLMCPDLSFQQVSTYITMYKSIYIRLLIKENLITQ